MTDTTWVAVDPADLKTGDKVRLTHDNGDIIHMTARKPFVSYGLFLSPRDAAGEGKPLARWSALGYRFERAVPDLPIAAGIYISASSDEPSDESPTIYWLPIGSATFYEMDAVGIDRIANDRMPRDLVRLVPSTEADELRARIEKAEADAIAGRIGFNTSGDREHLIRVLNGESE